MRNLRTRWLVAASTAAGIDAAIVGLASCAHGPSVDELASQRVVLTEVAPGADLGAPRTFAMTESIDVVVENQGGGPSTTHPADPAVGAATLEAIASEMVARGYVRVARTDRPDLGVAVTGVVRQNAVALYGAWWGYGAASTGYWGFGSASFTTGITSGGVALWRSGALVIELDDLRAARAAEDAASISGLLAAAPPDVDAGAGGTIAVVWGALVYGVIGGGTDATVTSAPIADIHQAFVQSPYLHAR